MGLDIKNMDLLVAFQDKMEKKTIDNYLRANPIATKGLLPLLDSPGPLRDNLLKLLARHQISMVKKLYVKLRTLRDDTELSEEAKINLLYTILSRHGYDSEDVERALCILYTLYQGGRAKYEDKEAVEMLVYALEKIDTTVVAAALHKILSNMNTGPKIEFFRWLVEQGKLWPTNLLQCMFTNHQD